MSFNNKTFLVTGGSSGIGFDAAKHLAEQGAKVYITGRNPEAVTRAAAAIGRKVVGVVSDTASVADSVKLADVIATNGGKLDGLFLNAGSANFVPFELVTEAQFDDDFNTNVRGAFFLIQKLLPVINDGASIVLNGAAAFNRGVPNGSVYIATKAAVNSFAKTLSRDLLPRRIRINVVNPGGVQTEGLGKHGLPMEVIKSIVEKQVPLTRLGRPDEITGYVAFLLSDKSTFILGTELSIDGGMTQL